MLVHALMFYLFAFVVVCSAIMVIVSRNPVHSVLFLILAFFNAAAIFLLQGAEFLAMIMVVVYVGAVAVLFLFVVMMLDINFKELRRGFVRHLAPGLLVAVVLAAELAIALLGWSALPNSDSVTRTPESISNTEAIGNLLYTHYIYLFQVAGMVLLVAMLAAITLTLRVRAGVKRQRIAEQSDRDTATEVELVDAPIGGGIEIKHED